MPAVGKKKAGTRPASGTGGWVAEVPRREECLGVLNPPVIWRFAVSSVLREVVERVSRPVEGVSWLAR
jgi:hypothetical protein